MFNTLNNTIEGIFKFPLAPPVAVPKKTLK